MDCRLSKFRHFRGQTSCKRHPSNFQASYFIDFSNSQAMVGLELCQQYVTGWECSLDPPTNWDAVRRIRPLERFGQKMCLPK